MEEVIQRDVEVYVTQVAKTEEDNQPAGALVTGPLTDLDNLTESSGDDYLLHP